LEKGFSSAKWHLCQSATAADTLSGGVPEVQTSQMNEPGVLGT